MLMQEFEGKNKNEAVKKALETLNLPEDKVTIEYIDNGKAGFFGFRGGRPARIKVYYEEIESDLVVKVKEFLNELFKLIGVEASIIYVKEDHDAVLIKISTEESGFLIGKRGKNLEAIQFLVNVIMNKTNEDWKKIVVDIEGYRNRREEAIKRLALKTADIVRKTKKSRLLDAMNPFERRVVHITLQDFNDIETKSEGEGTYKKVKVYLK